MWIHVRICKNEVSKAFDYDITPICRSPAGGGRGLLVVFLIRESAALVQAQGPSLFIIKSCDSLLVTNYSELNLENSYYILAPILYIPIK